MGRVKSDTSARQCKAALASRAGDFGPLTCAFCAGLSLEKQDWTNVDVVVLLWRCLLRGELRSQGSPTATSGLNVLQKGDHKALRQPCCRLK